MRLVQWLKTPSGRFAGVAAPALALLSVVSLSLSGLQTTSPVVEGAVQSAPTSKLAFKLSKDLSLEELEMITGEKISSVSQLGSGWDSQQQQHLVAALASLRTPCRWTEC